jgi:hypothetical protein
MNVEDIFYTTFIFYIEMADVFWGLLFTATMGLRHDPERYESRLDTPKDASTRQANNL